MNRIKKTNIAGYLKKITFFLLLLISEILRIPGHVKAVFKVLVHHLKYGTSLFNVIVMAIVTDPIILFLIAGIACWYYLEDLMKVISPN